MKSKSQNDRLQVLILGQSGAGKSSILDTYQGKDFNDSRRVTAAVDSATKPYIASDGSLYKTEIFDTAG